MSEPKLHHYVPQFYLRRFCDESARLWAWDRDNDRVFHTTPRSVAAEKGFYYLDLYAEEDPLAMEKQFAYLESDSARITDQWVEMIRAEERMTRLPIPDQNRKLVSQFLALQFIRTADFRDILSAFATERAEGELDDLDRRVLHTHALWDEDLVGDFTDYIESAIWVFGKNESNTPFITSDNPVAFRTPDNSMWMKVHLFGTETYAVYPLAPDIVMYCFPRVEPWLKTELLDGCISPVQFTEDLVVSENGGQVFMASRFVFSSRNHFADERAFASTIGTDKYA
jgi:hypothetical protein